MHPVLLARDILTLSLVSDWVLVDGEVQRLRNCQSKDGIFYVGTMPRAESRTIPSREVDE